MHDDLCVLVALACLLLLLLLQVESIVGLLWHEPQRLGRAFAELRALRPFLRLSVHDLAAAVSLSVGSSTASGDADAPGAADAQRHSKILTLLRSLRASNILHALVARLPRECSMPHVHAQMTPGQYSALLDSAALESQVRCYRAEWDWLGPSAKCSRPARCFLLPLQLRGVDSSTIPEAHLPVLRLFLGESAFSAADEVAWRLTSAALGEFELRVRASPGGNVAALSSIPEYALLVESGEALVRLARAPPAVQAAAPAAPVVGDNAPSGGE